MKTSFGKIRGIEAVQSFIRAVPQGVKKVALEAFSNYVVGNERHGLRHADPYKYVTRKSAYGVSFFTVKQRKWFFWALSTGQIDPGSGKRTGESTAAWKVMPINNGYNYRIENNTTGGFYTRHDTRQARQLGNVGWRKTMVVLAANYIGGIRAAIIAVNKYLKSQK